MKHYIVIAGLGYLSGRKVTDEYPNAQVFYSYADAKKEVNKYRTIDPMIEMNIKYISTEEKVLKAN